MDPGELEWSEADQVEAWRLDRLLAAGYPLPAARYLARRNDVDLHRAVQILEFGCAPELAERILA